MQVPEVPVRRGVSVAWIVSGVLALLLLLVATLFAFGVFRVQLFPLPIL